MKRTILLIAAPLVAVATLMIGLRVGAGEAVRSASVFAAPPTQGRLALQLLTYYEERKVRETVAMKQLTVVARAHGGGADEDRGSASGRGIHPVGGNRAGR